MTSSSDDSQSTTATRWLPQAGLQQLIFFSIVILYIAARFWRLTAGCLWFDEIFSIHAARHSWRELFSFVAADVVHPPLFYALLKIWIAAGGESLVWLRLFPFLISVAAIVPLALLCRALQLNAAETNLALLLLAVNGYLIKYAQEVRMYSLLFFLTLGSLWLFVRFVQEGARARKLLPALSAVNLLLVFTHYYGWMVLASEVGFVLIWQRFRLKSFLIALIAPVLCFSPWIYAVISVSRGQGLAQNIGWATRPRLSDLAQLFTLLNEPFYFRQSSIDLYSPWVGVLTIVLFGLPLLVLLWRRWKHEPGIMAGKSLRLLVSFTLLAPALAFILSWVLPQSIWGPRHLIVVAAPYAILAAIALMALRPIEVKYTLLILIGGWFVFAAAVALARPKPVNVWCAWEQLAHRLKQRPAGDDVTRIYAFEDLVAYHLWFALDANPHSIFRVGVIKDVPGIEEDKAFFLPRDFAEINLRNDFPRDENHIWIAFRDLTRVEARPPLNLAVASGYEVKNVLETDAGGEKAFLVELSRK